MLILEIFKQSRRLSTKTQEKNLVNFTLNLDPELILFVGMIDSPHFQKWLANYISEFPHMKVLIFPSDRPRKPMGNLFNKSKQYGRVEVFSVSRIRVLNYLLYSLADTIFGLKWRAYFLARVILRNFPSTIHFHETQHGAYIYNLIANVRGIPQNTRKILSTWGSDLILYSQFKSHRSKIESTLSWVNVLTAERQEDLQIAKSLGYKSKFESPIYVTVGTNIEDFPNSKPSTRKIVMVKGYQDLPGRALNALEAISKLDKEKFEFSFVVFSASKVVRKRIKELKQDFGIDIKYIEHISRDEMDVLFADARAAISLAISDGLPGSLVEAMKAGAFPIQSINSAGLDFIANGVNGFLVDPDNIEEIRNLLRRALLDDTLVDSAYPVNIRVLKEKYSLEVGRKKLRNLYL